MEMRLHLLQELASVLARVLNCLHKPVVEANAAFDVDWAQDRFVGRRVTHGAADLLAEIIFDLSALFVLDVSQLQHLRYSELESIDNLCHQLAGCRSLEGQKDLQAAIQLLMKQFGESPPEVSLPDVPAPTAQLDTGNLIPDEDGEEALLTPEERRARFNALKDELARPF